MNLSLRRSLLARAGLLFCALSTSSCLQLRFERDTRLEPVPKSALESLEPGKANLDSVLQKLGPPVYAWELPSDGAALAWGWFHSGIWQFKFSIPTPQRAMSLYLDYGSQAESMRGAVFFFDSHWNLVAVREGMIRDLREATRSRPELSEEAEKAAKVEGGSSPR